MARRLRELTEDTIYHAMTRGNNKQTLFYCDKDFERYLDYAQTALTRRSVKIYCFVLMPNHVHFVLKNVKSAGLSKFMHLLQTSYGVYFNRKYGNCGHVFQGRFQSRIVMDDIYLTYLSKYIHLNPVSAGLVKLPGEYRWSSYSDYLKSDKKTSFVDNTYLKSIFSDQFSRQDNAYAQFVEERIIELGSDPKRSGVLTKLNNRYTI